MTALHSPRHFAPAPAAPSPYPQTLARCSQRPASRTPSPPPASVLLVTLHPLPPRLPLHRRIRPQDVRNVSCVGRVGWYRCHLAEDLAATTSHVCNNVRVPYDSRPSSRHIFKCVFQREESAAFITYCISGAAPVVIKRQEQHPVTWPVIFDHHPYHILSCPAPVCWCLRVTGTSETRNEMHSVLLRSC